MTPDSLQTLGFAMGSAWLSGINLYATVVTLGLLERFRLVRLPGDLEALGQWWIIILAGVLYLIEFIADKIPAVDSAWDAVHTFIRVPAGAVLAASAFADFDPRFGGSPCWRGEGLPLARTEPRLLRDWRRTHRRSRFRTFCSAWSRTPSRSAPPC